MCLGTNGEWAQNYTIFIWLIFLTSKSQTTKNKVEENLGKKYKISLGKLLRMIESLNLLMIMISIEDNTNSQNSSYYLQDWISSQ